MGIFTRLFYGGIVEEVIFRFGLMSFFVRLGSLMLDHQLAAIWIGNLLAAIFFALIHLPETIISNERKSDQNHPNLFEQYEYYGRIVLWLVILE